VIISAMAPNLASDRICRAAETRGDRARFPDGAKFIGSSGASLILGDNIFYGKLDFYAKALAIERGACIFGYQVRDPQRYAWSESTAEGKAISLEENRSGRKVISPYQGFMLLRRARSRFLPNPAPLGPRPNSRSRFEFALP